MRLLNWVLLAAGLYCLAGCGAGPEGGRVEDALPPYAVPARTHEVTLTAHSFAREGEDHDVCASPDGMWIVFTSTRNSPEPQLYRKSVDGTVATQLTKGPYSHIQPAVSPDGREIAFAGNDAGTWDVWITPAAGGPRENFTSTQDLDEMHPAWGPSGEALCYNSLSRREGEWWICAKTRRGGGVSWITTGLLPHWSPGGDKIVFQRASTRGRRLFSIWTVDVTVGADGLVEGSSETQIVKGADWAAVDPVFSPDGGRIVFATVSYSPEARWSSSRRSRREKAAPAALSRGDDIWCVRLDGGDLIRLTWTPEPEWSPSWGAPPGGPGSPGRVFFTSRRGGHVNIWSVLPLFARPGPPRELAEEAPSAPVELIDLTDLIEPEGTGAPAGPGD